MDQLTPTNSVQSSTATERRRPILLTYAAIALQDLVHGLVQWRLWYLMGSSDMRRRFARSRLGPLWITVSSAISVATIGIVWSYLWQIPVREILPYIAVHLTMWQFIATGANESASALPANTNYFLNQYLSASTILFAQLYRNILTLALNLIFPLLVCLTFGVEFTFYAAMSLLGFVFLLGWCFWTGYAIAILCTRFRDLVQVVASLFTVLFFVTPILWKPELLPAEAQYYLSLNPFAVLMSVTCDPLLNRPVPASYWLAAFVLSAGGLILILPFIGKYRRRIVYWL